MLTTALPRLVKELDDAWLRQVGSGWTARYQDAAAGPSTHC